MHANPSATPAININTGGGGVGYVICLAGPGSEVLEGEMSEVGGVQYGRPMTAEERRTGVLNRARAPAMIDVTPGADDRPSSALPTRSRGYDE